MRPFVVAGFVLVVIVAGTLGLVGFSQGSAEQRQQRYAVAYETAAVATSDTIGATMIARQQADTDLLKATVGAEATRSLATLEASHTALAATVTADQVSAHATSTALATH